MRWNEPAPGERDAGERSWLTVRAAWEERVPAERVRRFRRTPLVAIAVGVAVAAAALSPPGRAVLGSIRDAVRGEKNAKPALYSLPTYGRLLVNTSRGAWVVQRDGSKRLLSEYRDVSWSPHALYLVGVHGHEVRAFEPNGAVHWSIARPGTIRYPVWTDATPPCCRIAYLDGTTLRVVNGDGSGDRPLARHVSVVQPVWRPGTHQLAYVESSGRVLVVDADTARPVSTWVEATPRQLDWSPDGKLLAARTAEGPIWVYKADGTRVVGISTASISPGRPFSAIAFRPSGETLAYISYDPSLDQSVVTSDDLRPPGRVRRVFSGAGRFEDLVWSPDGRWLALDWTSADELVFIRSASVRNISAVQNVAANFGAAATLGGWCCP